MTDYFEKKIEVLISAFKDAASRTRSVFMIMNLATSLCFIAFLNSAYFWSFSVNDEKTNVIKSVILGPDNNLKPTKALDSIATKAFKKSVFEQLSYINMPVIGIRFFLFDLGLINAIAMVILSTWFFFCSRRECQIIHEVYTDITTRKHQEGFNELADYVFQGIANQSVFSTVTSNDFVKTNNKKGNKQNKAARLLKQVLVYAPVISISIIFIRDFVLSISLGFANFNGPYKWYFTSNLLLPFIALLYCINQALSCKENDETKVKQLSEIYELTKSAKN